MTSGDPLRVTALTQGEHVPSARFRVRQLVPALAAEGIDLRESWSTSGAYPPLGRAARLAWFPRAVGDSARRAWRSRDSDVVLLQRELVSTLPTFEWAAGRPRVVDVDDAIWLFRRGVAARTLAACADLVICGNRFLADWFEQHCRRVEIVPTAVDTRRYDVPAQRPSRRRIGWIGTRPGFRYLEQVMPAIGQVLDRHPDAEFCVMSDVDPRPPSLPPERYRFERWHPDREVAALQSFTVGIMPLADGDFERGKCSFKLLTYLAAGVPAVVSPVGMNQDVLARGRVGVAARSLGQWVEALSAMLDDPDRATTMGREGRRVVEAHYSVARVAPRVAAILRDVAGV